MHIRSQRPSDVVAWVCVPVTLILYLNLMMLQPPNPAPPPPRAATGWWEGEEGPRAPHGVSRVGPPLNVTSRGRGDLLLVTPILRCGSTTLLNLLKLLAPQNGFALHPRPPRLTEYVHLPDPKQQWHLVRNISSVPTPAAVMESFAYINFTKFGQAPPVQVGLVRDPVERAISWFYHVRAPFTLVERHVRFPSAKLPSRTFLKKDLETCLRNPRDLECRYVPGRESLGHTVEFFCGHHSFCPVFGDRAGLAEAVDVVERGWAVVGLLEHWNKTLAVLEHYVPRFFQGAARAYHEHLKDNNLLQNVNFYRPKVDLKAKDFLRDNFEVEYEFYQFLEQRLDRQYRALGLHASPDL